MSAVTTYGDFVLGMEWCAHQWRAMSMRGDPKTLVGPVRDPMEDTAPQVGREWQKH